MLSAYLNDETSEIVIVGINYSEESKDLCFTDFTVENIYVTSKNGNLKASKVRNKRVRLESRSVSTLIGH
ncbi:hypothetical protein [Flavicella sediminum]|uniref:hypothetical protein n=1 Tax=Flavicella sediminum TaxID=2585141 RepID=UPI0011241987|nr:hypothetical protein [Flavicella sediminum]